MTDSTDLCVNSKICRLYMYGEVTDIPLSVIIIIAVRNHNNK